MVVAQWCYTADERYDSPRNTTLVQLVDGIPVERMMTSGDHGEVAGVLWDWLHAAHRAGCGRIYAGPTDALLDPEGERSNLREPDLCFFRLSRAPERPAKGVEGVPDRVIEILLPGNRGDDLWNSYERFGVPAYWLVDPESRVVIEYERRQGRLVEAATLRTGDSLTCALFSALPLPVADLFTAIGRE